MHQFSLIIYPIPSSIHGETVHRSISTWEGSTPLGMLLFGCSHLLRTLLLRGVFICILLLSQAEYSGQVILDSPPEAKKIQPDGCSMLAVCVLVGLPSLWWCTCCCFGQEQCNRGVVVCAQFAIIFGHVIPDYNASQRLVGSLPLSFSHTLESCALITRRCDPVL